MVFEQFEYRRPDYERIKAEMEKLFEKLRRSTSVGEAIRCSVDIDKIRREYMSMKKLSGLLFSIDLNNRSYVEENDYFDDYWPYYKELNARYYKEILASKFLEEFKAFYGEQFIKLMECTIGAIDESILDELQEEQKLISANFCLKTNAEIEFRGEKHNLSTLSGYLTDSDRQTRKEASDAFYGFYESAADEIETTFDNLVKVRDKKAKKMGYESFTEMGYNEMQRTDYDKNMVACFREEVRQYMTPLAEKLIKRQMKRLGVSSLPYYDETVKFASGNPLPKGTSDEILQTARKMYEDMSPETGEYFNYMMDTHLIDVLPRRGKEGSGFESYIDVYRAPFLFANFNGTSDDITLMTHEAGHCFQSYMSRNIDTPELVCATMETSEIHSMSMELFTMPQVDRFFGKEGADKYRFSLIERAVQKIPYCAVVDEFQHLVYANPKATKSERRKMWRDTERKYLPYKDYTGSPFLESGTWWFQQGHPFFRPFYYIDYGLAQTCALAFLVKMGKDYESAWKDYIELCKLGGTRSFQNLLKVAGIASPFEKGMVKSVAEYVEKYLDEIDDMSM